MHNLRVVGDAERRVGKSGGIVPGLIRVTPEQLQTTSAQLTGQVNALGADWAGAGQQRFLAAYQQWQAAQANLHAALETIAQLTARAAVAYATNDQQVAATFR